MRGEERDRERGKKRERREKRERRREWEEFQCIEHVRDSRVLQ